MKKYSILISFTVMIILVYTVFFMSSKNLTASFPQIGMHDIEGDPSLIESIALEGTVQMGTYLFDESFTYDKDGTTYEVEKPWTERYGVYRTREFSDLMKKYPSYMRGKEDYPPYFLETEDVVVYAGMPMSGWEMNPNKFEVSVLEKSSEKEKSFTAEIPDYRDYWMIDIRNIHYKDGKVFLTTVNSVETSNSDALNDSVNIEVDSYDEEVFVYTFDLAEEKLIDAERVYTFQGKETDEAVDYVQLFETNEGSGELFIASTNEKFSENIELSHEGFTLNQLSRLNVETKDVEEVKMGKESPNGQILQANKDHLYFLQSEKGRAVLLKYNIENGDIEKSLILENGALSYEDAQMAYVEVKDNYLYLVPMYMFEPGTKLVVFDTDTLERKYIGELIVENEEKFKSSMIEMYIDNVYMSKD